MNIYQFMSESPWLSFFIAWLISSLLKWPFRLVNRWIRHRNIVARGWPPSHLDADGDWKKDASALAGAAMSEKPLNCVGIDPSQQDTGSHDFRPDFPVTNSEMNLKPSILHDPATGTCDTKDLIEALRWYASKEAYETEGRVGDTVYDRLRREVRVLIDRGQRARAVLTKFGVEP